MMIDSSIIILVYILFARLCSINDHLSTNYMYYVSKNVTSYFYFRALWHSEISENNIAA